MSKFNVVLVLALLWSPFATVRAETYTPGKTVQKDFKSFAKSFLDQHCTDCHGATDPEGNLSLVDLGPVDEVNSAVWKNCLPTATLPSTLMIRRKPGLRKKGTTRPMAPARSKG